MNIHTILQAKYAGKKYILVGDDYEGLEWLDESPKPTKKELEALAPQVEYEIAYENVQRERQIAYANESDYLYFYAERGKGTKQAWLDKIAEIDARLPYPDKPSK